MAIENTFKDVRRALSELNTANQELESTSDVETAATAIRDVLSSASDLVVYLDRVWSAKELRGLPKPTSVSIQLSGATITWPLLK